MGVWQSHDQDVLVLGSLTTPWTSLDLSSIVGTQQAFCLFGVTVSVNTRRIAFRRAGSPLTCLHIDSSHHGMQYTQCTANKWYLLACPTNAVGAVEYRFNSSSGTATIRLLGYQIPSEQGPSQLETNYSFPTTGWAGYDISANMGSNRGYAVMSYGRFGGVGTPTWGMRSPGDTRSSAYIADARRGGANRGILAASGQEGCFGSVETNVSGVFEHSAERTPAYQAPIWFECAEVDNWQSVNAVVQDTILPGNSWSDVDLSAHVSSRALCVLKLEHGATGVSAGNLRSSVRRKGETRDFSKTSAELGHGPGIHEINLTNGRAGDMLVECNDNGIVEIYQADVVVDSTQITLVGFIEGNPAPTISNNTPTGGDESAEVTVGFDSADNSQVEQLLIDLDLTDPALGTANAIIDGVFQSGYGGTINANGSNGYDVRLTKHPVFEPGLWQADAYVEDDAGSGASLGWSWTVGAMALVEGAQSSLNSVDIEFDEDPRYLDPLGTNDARNLSNYSITGPTSPARLLLSVEYLELNKIRLHYDGALVPGELYVIGVSNVISTTGHLIDPSPSTFQFIAFGADAEPTPLTKQAFPSDIRNPQTVRDAPSDSPLGTFVVKGGNLDIESARQYLRKRVWRRLGTKRGSMFHLPNYGLLLNDKALYTPTELRRLQNEIKEQVGSEQGVRGVAVSVRQLEIGVVYLKISVVDKFGTFTDEGAIGGE